MPVSGFPQNTLLGPEESIKQSETTPAIFWNFPILRLESDS